MQGTVGVIGVGAFGEFIIRYLAPYFKTYVYDNQRDLQPVVSKYNVDAAPMETVAKADYVILAVPVQQITAVAKALCCLLEPGCLVMDVCSVKGVPAEILKDILPEHAHLVGLHPLFGPQSGKEGISGLNVAVCDVRGGRGKCVSEFLNGELGLNVIRTTPERHDAEVAISQGLTHLIGRILMEMAIPRIEQTTRTYDHLESMVELIRYDSDELFVAIERQNPSVKAVIAAFFESAERVKSRLDMYNENSV